MDPKSETSRRFSPYTYEDDNSIRNIDPDGMETEEANFCGVHFISALPGSPLNKAIDWVADQLGFPTTKEVTKVITGTATPEEKGALKVKTMYSIVNILTMGEGGEGEGGAGGEGGGKYSGLKEPRTVGDGLKTTPARRRRILEANKTANGGTLKSDLSGKPLDPPVQAKKV